MPPLFLLIIGLIVVIGGAELLVRGASRLALAVGLSPLVVGLVFVSLGTSAPEAAITIDAAFRDRGDMAVGNIFGSNIFNTLLILGISALIVPLFVKERLVRIDIPIMVGLSVLVLLFAWNGHLSRFEGFLLIAAAAAYTALNLRLGRKEAKEDRSLVAPIGMSAKVLSVLFLIAGGILLVIGARLTVDAGVGIAVALGASELVIGLTVLAFGTSLPELVTSLVAALRGERDIAIGNIVGSNILNITLILGLAAGIAPGALEIPRGAITFDLPVMIACAVALLPIAFTGQAIVRWEGAVFLIYYLAYVSHLFLEPAMHPFAEDLDFALLWFALPLTVLVLAAALLHEVRQRIEGRRTPPPG